MDWPWSRAPKRTPKQVAESPRLGNRFTPIGLSCRLGDVIDLSATGARIRCLTKPALQVGDGVRMNISNGTSAIAVRARVVWVRRSRDSGTLFDLGMNFLELTPELMDDLLEMARFGFLRPKPAPVSGTTPGASAAKASSARPSTGTQNSGTGPSSDPGPRPSSGNVTASIEVEDLYALLEVPRSASKDQVHAAFRALARKLHPDRNTAPDADQQFARVSKAYSVLRDPEMRQRYDAMLNGNQSRAA